MRDDILLCYEFNGEPLNTAHGAPLRLVVPGWYGVAWVKWLSRIEVLDRRIMSKYMAREYVTLRAEERGEKTLWRETSIGPMLIKSIAARALRLKDGTIRVQGAAWGNDLPLAKVELQIDDGSWQSVTLDKNEPLEKLLYFLYQRLEEPCAWRTHPRLPRHRCGRPIAADGRRSGDEAQEDLLGIQPPVAAPPQSLKNLVPAQRGIG